MDYTDKDVLVIDTIMRAVDATGIQWPPAADDVHISLEEIPIDWLQRGINAL